MISMKRKHILLLSSLVLLILLAVYFKIWNYIQPDLLLAYLERLGFWMPVIYSLLYLVAVFIPHAGTAMTVLGGFLFNPFIGTLLVIVLSSVGSVMPFLLAKTYARKRIAARIAKTKYKKYLHHMDKNSFMFVLYMRLIPGIPYELQSYICGLVDISVGKFVLATAIGLLPGTFTIMYLGTTIKHASTTNISILIAITLFGLLLPLVLKKFTRAKEILQEE